MGTTIRREPNLTALPKKVTPHYENMLNFKGLHITDNPFTADSSSASDMLNVYVDDNNALTVRPRLEKTTDLTNFINGYTLVKTEPLKNGQLLLLLNDTTPIIKLIINNIAYTIYNINNINPYTCSFYEDGDISVDGKIYLFDENGAKTITKIGQHYSISNMSDIAYVPTVEIHKDTFLEISTKKEPYNVFTNKYKISYSTPTTPYDYSVDFAVGKQAVVTTNDASYETADYQKHHAYLTSGILRKNTSELIIDIATSKTGDVVIYCTSDYSCFISLDYGRSFDRLFCNENDILIPVNARTVAISGDGTTILTITSTNILKMYKNRVLIYSENLENISYNGEIYRVNSNITSANITINNSGSTWAISKVFKPAENNPFSDKFVYLANINLTNNITVNKDFIDITDNDTQSINVVKVLLSSDGLHCAILYNNYINEFVTDNDSRIKFLNTSLKTFSNYFQLTQSPLTIDIGECIWKTDNLFICKKNETQILNIKIEDINNISTQTYTIPSNYYNMQRGFFINIQGFLYYVFFNDMALAYKITFDDYNNIETCDMLYLLNSAADLSDYTKIALADNYWFILTFSEVSGVYELYSNNAYSIDKDWISVVYTDHTTQYAINTATNYAIWQDKLWLYGVKNLLGWSGVNDENKRDFTYIPENQVLELGIDTTPKNEKTDITGFNVIGDNVASAYKRNKIYLITPTIVNNINTYMYSECKAEQGNATVGETVTTPLTALPIQINRDGVFALTNLKNVYAADKIATLISAKINDKFLKEDLSKIKLIAFKYWLLIFIPDDITHVYVYDDRSAEWFYWELPINILNIFKTHDDLYCVSIDNKIYKLNAKEKVVAINSDDAITLYYDDVYLDGADNCFNAYGVQGKNIVWYWTSQILPLNSVSYAKQLNKTTFIVADSDVTDGYAFNFSIKGWRKKRTLVKSSDLDGTVYSVQATTKRTNINRAHFIQITVTNAMLENHQLMLNKTLKTDIDTNDQKVRLIGVSFKYKYLEV